MFSLLHKGGVFISLIMKITSTFSAKLKTAIKFLLSTICLFLFLTQHAQNLVLNPSFEEYDEKTKYPLHWTRINLTPDIYSKNLVSGHSLKNKDFLPPFNSNFGNTFIGICISLPGADEMIKGEFTNPLKDNTIYEVSLQAIRPKVFGSNHITKTLNIFISDSILTTTNIDSLRKFKLKNIYPYQKIIYLLHLKIPGLN